MEVLPRGSAHRSRDRDEDRLALDLDPTEPTFIGRRLYLDEDDPGYLGERFLRAVYRTTRALLLAKELLDPGQSLYESVIVRVDENLLAIEKKISHSSALAAIADEAGHLPTAPKDDSSPEDVEKIATSHGYAALQLGYEINDPCLHWLHKDLIQEFFPSLQQLLAFEFDLIQAVGIVTVRDGRMAGMLWLNRMLGEVSHLERKDWSGLANAYLRDFSTASTEDDRLLMVARLEDIASRARGALDTRTELAAANALAKVQGLAFIDDTKSQREMVLLLGNRQERQDVPLPKLPS